MKWRACVWIRRSRNCLPIIRAANCKPGSKRGGSRSTATLKAKDKLDGGEEITLDAEAEVVMSLKPEDIPLDIVYEDESLLIVNKPAGLVVHPAVGNWHGTLLNALLNHDPISKPCPEPASCIGSTRKPAAL